MPKISSAFSTIKVSLPSYKDSQVELKTNIPIGDTVEAEKVDGYMAKSVFLVSRMIVSWNFQDEKGNDLPITEETLKQLPTNDLTFLMDKITPYIEKKTPSGKTK